MKKQFPELTFSFDSEQMEFFTNTSMSSRYPLLHTLSSVVHGFKSRVIHKKLSTSGIIYDRLQIGQHMRVVLSLDDNLFLLWYGASSLLSKIFLPSLPFFFEDYISINVEPSFTITARNAEIHSRFDHFCSENIRPKDYRIFEKNEAACRFAKITFQYQHAFRNLFQRIKYRSCNIFWVIQTGPNIVTPLLVISYYRKYNYRKSIVTIKVAFENKTYIVFVPQRPRQVKLRGFEKIPQESEIMVTQFIDGEADVLWTVSGNEIRRYG